jgi:hypothetical protein
MAKFTDWESGKEVQDIMEKFLEKFPDIFSGFRTDGIHFIKTKKKKANRPINLRTVGYPFDVFVGKPYIVEVFAKWWDTMNQKQRNLAVFHIMCAVPDGGFDDQSKHYAKKLKPEIEMYTLEFAATGGVPNWMDNPSAVDPMNSTADQVALGIPGAEAIPAESGDGIERIPVTQDALERVTEDAEVEPVAV